MDKIPTLLVRDQATRKVKPELAIPKADLWHVEATEKLDGTNVRLTVRYSQLVRVEARRNPTREQKIEGIGTPWYRDVWLIGGPPAAPQDRWIADAAVNTNLREIPDGEWPGEAVGPRIQGNGYDLPGHTVVLFSVPSVRERITFPPEDPPIFMPVGGGALNFGGLREWLQATDSLFAPGHPIEGFVLWADGMPLAKLKAKDFAFA